jgi:hypothetical protein
MRRGLKLNPAFNVGDEIFRLKDFPDEKGIETRRLFGFQELVINVSLKDFPDEKGIETAFFKQEPFHL